MESIIQLIKFYFDECSVKWAGDNLSLAEIDHRFSMDYHIWANDQNERVYKKQLILRVEPANESGNGYTIECHITGIFAFPEDADISKIPLTLRMNGSAILYGILRGQIASLTGTFKAGILPLPTINMKDVVEQIEKKKMENRIVEQPVKSIKASEVKRPAIKRKKSSRTKAQGKRN